ncbi:hypothetical protein KBD59_00115 [Candidatus Gracilibacteria bacterium]|nr:hypothetical protein [Candidatus Gracilibacteria bacterium]
MSLKQIPNEGERKDNRAEQKSAKHFNPGNQIKQVPNGAFSLKSICLELVHYINRGSKYSYEQVDELIHRLQRGVIGLQKTKHEMLLQKKDKKLQKDSKKRRN